MLGIELWACEFNVDLKDDGGREFVPKVRKNADTRSGSELRSAPRSQRKGVVLKLDAPDRKDVNRNPAIHASRSDAGRSQGTVIHETEVIPGLVVEGRLRITSSQVVRRCKGASTGYSKLPGGPLSQPKREPGNKCNQNTSRDAFHNGSGRLQRDDSISLRRQLRR